MKHSPPRLLVVAFSVTRIEPAESAVLLGSMVHHERAPNKVRGESNGRPDKSLTEYVRKLSRILTQREARLWEDC